MTELRICGPSSNKSLMICMSMQRPPIPTLLGIDGLIILIFKSFLIRSIKIKGLCFIHLHVRSEYFPLVDFFSEPTRLPEGFAC